jgi:GR25 family glycosyltransferase involved in LPS biosynthesis
MDLYNHIFVINLEERKDRLESVTKELGDLQWERYNAVRPDFNEIPHWFRPEETPGYRRGAYGCMMSHYNIIKIAKERNYKRVLILEDDTGLKNSMDILYKAVEQLNSKNLKWGLLYLSGTHRERCVKIDENVVKIVKSYTTNSYIVDSSVYDMILQDIPGWSFEIDVYYGTVIQKRFDCYCTKPHVTYQKPSKSDILNRHISYEDVMIDP